MTDIFMASSVIAEVLIARKGIFRASNVYSEVLVGVTPEEQFLGPVNTMTPLADRVKDSTLSTGTGTITLADSAPLGFRTFAAAFGSGSTLVNYCIDDAVGNWEVGSGTFNGTTGLSRIAALSSSNDNELVTFSDGLKTVFCTAPAALLNTTADYRAANFVAGVDYVAPSGNAATATTATNQEGGVANQIQINTGVSSSGFIDAPTAGSTYLGWTGSTFAWSASTGPSGADGVSGEPGSPGAKGDTGTTGAAGSAGATGPSGNPWGGGTFTGPIAVTGAITATGNITAYYSDDRLKTNLGSIQNALDKVKTLSGFYFEANATAQSLGYEIKREVGVSAQQVQRVMPEVISPAPIDPQYMTVHYDKLIPLLIEAIKELSDKVDAL